MAEQIAWIALFAAIAALFVPLVVLLLARLGQFEPISFVALGREWRFAPKIRQVSLHSDASIAIWPRHTAFASIVTVAISIAPPISASGNSPSVSPFSDATSRSGNLLSG